MRRSERSRWPESATRASPAPARDGPFAQRRFLTQGECEMEDRRELRQLFLAVTRYAALVQRADQIAEVLTTFLKRGVHVVTRRARRKHACRARRAEAGRGTNSGGEVGRFLHPEMRELC